MIIDLTVPREGTVASVVGILRDVRIEEGYLAYLALSHRVDLVKANITHSAVRYQRCRFKDPPLIQLD